MDAFYSQLLVIALSLVIFLLVIFTYKVAYTKMTSKETEPDKAASDGNSKPAGLILTRDEEVVVSHPETEVNANDGNS